MEALRANSPGLPLGAQSGVSPLPTNGSGNSTPGRSSAASQSPGSSRIAVAYRLMKQWVEDMLVSDLNPTVYHVSKHQNCPETATVPSAAGCDPFTSQENKREGKTTGSGFSRSSCSATPVSRTRSPDVGQPPIVLPGSLSESSHHYSNGLPWQVASSYLSPRGPPGGSHIGTARHDFCRDPSPPQRGPATSNQVPNGTSKTNYLAGDMSANQDLTMAHNGHFDPQREARVPGEAMKQPGSSTLPTVMQSAAEENVNDSYGRGRNQPNSSWAPSAADSREDAQRTARAEPCNPASRAPSERTSFLQYGSFRVRWGDVKTEPSPVGRLRAFSMCESATDCDISSTLEPREAARRAYQPADRPVPAFDVPLPGTEGTAVASNGNMRTSGLQNTESLLWRMKDRLSSTFWCV